MSNIPVQNNFIPKPRISLARPSFKKKPAKKGSVSTSVSTADSFVKSGKDQAAVKEQIAEIRQDWKYKGKRLGMISAATAAVKAAPILAAAAGLAGAYVAPLAIVGGLVIAGVEEKKLGLGKKLGGFIGDKVGAGVAYVKTKLSRKPPSGVQEKIVLPRVEAKGKRAKEAILPTIIHRVEEKITGKEAKVSRAGKIGAHLGASVVASSALLGVPVAGAFIGGPLGAVASTVIAGALGFAAGNIEENSIGVGRAVGELTGRAVGAVKSGVKKVFGKITGSKAGDSKPAKSKQEAHKPGLMTDLNNTISEPVIGFLMSTAGNAARLFQEKPVQTMDFNERGGNRINKDRLQNNFKKLAGINATSFNEKEVTKELQRQLDLMGIPYKTKDDGTLIATVQGTVKDAPTVVLSAHQDTVDKTAPEAIISDGPRIRTDEKHILGADDRAGIAEIMEGVKTVLEKGIDHPEIKMVFTTAEEVGLVGSTALDGKEITDRPALGFIVDATDKNDLYLKMDGNPQRDNCVGYNFSQEDPLVQVAMKSMADAGIKPRPIHAPAVIGAMSDANTVAFNNDNIRSIAVGCGASDVHTTIENIKTKDMEQVAQAVVGYISNTCDLKVDENNKIVPRFDNL